MPTEGATVRGTEIYGDPGPGPWVGVAHARAGLLGNPGDGYGGKALATPILDFEARVTVERAARFELRPHPGDGLRYGSLGAAVRAFAGGGSEDALRLLRAAVRRFWTLAGAPDPEQGAWAEGLALRYETTIPRQVGLAGSSALIVATLRALAGRFALAPEPFDLAESALAAEVEDLGIAAGPMDRIVQSYGQVVVMELAPPRTPRGVRRLDPALLPPLFLAWSPLRTKSSGRLHAPLRERWERGDPDVLEVIHELRELVDRGVRSLEDGDVAGFADAVSRNFELRSRIFPIHEGDREMVELADRHGCAAKLAGSGGAIIGVVPQGADPQRLEAAFRARRLPFLRPRVAPRAPNP